MMTRRLLGENVIRNHRPSGKPSLMTCGEIIQHVALHGSNHRGMAHVILQKNGIKPNDDRVTDLIELGA